MAVASGALQKTTWTAGGRRKTFHYSQPRCAPPCHIALAVGGSHNHRLVGKPLRLMSASVQFGLDVSDAGATSLRWPCGGSSLQAACRAVIMLLHSQWRDMLAPGQFGGCMRQSDIVCP